MRMFANSSLNYLVMCADSRTVLYSVKRVDIYLVMYAYSRLNYLVMCADSRLSSNVCKQ
jgi:hypothetical protein